MENYAKWPQEIKNIHSYSKFHQAIANLDPKTVEECLKSSDKNDDILEPMKYHGSYNFTPLHMIIHIDPKEKTKERMRIIRLLLWHGSRENVKDENGNTPLHIAAMNPTSRLAIFEILIKYKTDTTIKNNFGKSAFDVMMSCDIKFKELKLILDKAPEVFNLNKNRSLIAEFFMNDIVFRTDLKATLLDRIVENTKPQEPSILNRNAHHNLMLLTDMVDDSPIDLNDEERKSRQLHVNYNELVRRLILKGCQVNHQDKLGKTALHFAVKFQNDRAVKALLDGGADSQIIDKMGKSTFALVEDIMHNSYQNLSDLGKRRMRLIRLMLINHLKRTGKKLNA